MSDLIPGFKFRTDRLIWSKPKSGRYTVALDDGTYMIVYPDGHWERLDIDASGYIVINKGNEGLNPADFSPIGLMLAGKAAAEAFYEELKSGIVVPLVTNDEPTSTAV